MMWTGKEGARGRRDSQKSGVCEPDIQNTSSSIVCGDDNDGDPAFAIAVDQRTGINVERGVDKCSKSSRSLLKRQRSEQRSG